MSSGECTRLAVTPPATSWPIRASASRAPPQCGLDHAHTEAEISPDSIMSPMMAQAVSASYDSLCENRVAGACLLLELEVAFDRQFQDRFPGDYVDRALSILNMVEGFYFEQLGIGLDTLSMTFLQSEPCAVPMAMAPG